MGCGPEIARNRLVTSCAVFGSDKFGPGNARRRKNSAAWFEVTARKQNQGERGSAPDHPPEFFALTVDPSS